MKQAKVTIFSLLLVLCITLLGFILFRRIDGGSAVPAGSVSTDTPAASVPAAPEASAVPTAAPIVATPEPEPTPEPTPEVYTLSFIGDLTLTNHQFSSDFETRMNGDYSYPLSNVVDYFDDDEYTFGNLECTFSDRNLSSIQTFFFRAPTAHAQILIEGGVDFVTTANNHTNDFNDAGVTDTSAALEEYNIPYGLNDQAQVVTTPHGLRIGVYCQYNGKYGDYRPDLDKALAGIEKLKAEEPDLIICMFHAGKELWYRPTDEFVEICHACIDAGVDIVYNTHPHCLQPVEQYKDGLILYSMGNFCFGGNTAPKDRDTAIVQVQLLRESDGTLRTLTYTMIPCCVSSRPVYEGYTRDNYNDYKPTPYEPGTEDYERAMSKIDGSYDGPNGVADYSSWHASHG